MVQQAAAPRGTRFEELFGALLDNVEQAIRGKRDVVRLALVCLLSEGHLLIEDVPGVGKTSLAKAIARSIGGTWRRIQFTPDLLPSDVTGVSVWNRARGEFEFRPGGVFAHVVLADEINRASPKTQSALLESMEERQVTVDAHTYRLSRPFMVIATQNPIELEGTYPLPEAQLDRFLLNVLIRYPDEDHEVEIVERTTTGRSEQAGHVLNRGQVMQIQSLVHATPVAPHVVRYAVRLVKHTRPGEPQAPQFIRDWVSWGAGPRASQHLVLAAKARALMRGAPAAAADDIRALAPAVLRHRVIPNFTAEAEGVKVDSIIERIIKEVPQDPGRIRD